MADILMEKQQKQRGRGRGRPFEKGRSANPAGPSAFQRLRIVRAQAGVRPTRAATSAGAGGASERVRSQRICQWVFSTPSRQPR